MEQQWAGAAGGLPCGSSVIDTEGQVIAVGRNHAYGPAGGLRHASNILCNITAWHMPNSTPWDNPRGLV
jgi:tRNA(Arg) A34 adenosine deaminase TadA